MASTRFRAEIGYGIDRSVVVQGTVETEPPGLSGLYVKLFCPADTEAGNPLLCEAQPLGVPLRCERRYELASGDPLRVEVDATAGSSGAAVTAWASSSDGTTASAAGLTNETLALILLPAS